MDKVEFNGRLGFWDYIHIAFYTTFRPKKLAEVGPVRATLWALPNGKTFVQVSPRLQELRPLVNENAPLPMPGPLPMSILAENIPTPGPGGILCTTSSPELDDEFEAAIQKRDAEELIAHAAALTNPNKE